MTFDQSLLIKTCKPYDAKEITIHENEDDVIFKTEYGTYTYDVNCDSYQSYAKIMNIFTDYISNNLKNFKNMVTLNYKRNLVLDALTVYNLDDPNCPENYKNHYFSFLKDKPSSLKILNIEDIFGISENFLDGIEELIILAYFSTGYNSPEYPKFPKSLKSLSIGMICCDEAEFFNSFNQCTNLTKFKCYQGDVIGIDKESWCDKFEVDIIKNYLKSNIDNFDFSD